MTPFRPFKDQSVKLSVTDTSVSSVIYSKDRRRESISLRVFNESPDTVFISFGDDTVTANISNSFPIPGGMVEVIALNTLVPYEDTYVAAIKASGTGSLWLSPGIGY
jgi:hypothetical protein